jgi:stage II sporulation protein R
MNFLRNIRNKTRNNKQPYIHRNSSALQTLASTACNNPRNFAPLQTILLISILLFCTVTAWLIKLNSVHNSSLQTGIAEDIIRFHVIANSDSAEDQALKLTVKDTLVESLKPFLNDTGTITQARTVISDKLTYLQEIAEQIIQQNGYNYPVKVNLEECYFPLKIYGDYSFPAGTYEALKVQIGTAEGKNWWCVMFPPLCFVDETYSIVDEKSGETLKHLLTEEEYDSLISKKTPVKVKFKLFEAIKNLFR